MTASQYRFIWGAISEKVEEAKRLWRENDDPDFAYIYENKYAHAQNALDEFERFYLAM